MLVNTLKIPERKVKIVNLGCDLSQFKKNDERKNTSLKAKYSISKDEKVILLYGRLAPVKGHLFLLDAIEKLPECKRKKLKLIFPGENERYKEEIVSRAKEMQITNNIVFPGYIKGIDFLSISDLMVLPSKSEGFGIVNVESFALGVPVVRTKTAGYEDMKDYCFGVEYGDTDQLTMYINYLWDNQEVLNERAFYAKQNVSRFSMQAMAEGYIHIYEKCMSN